MSTLNMITVIMSLAAVAISAIGVPYYGRRITRARRSIDYIHGRDTSRKAAKAYANLFGYFWLPCPTCGQMFGGHEIGGSVPVRGDTSLRKCICKPCAAAGKGDAYTDKPIRRKWDEHCADALATFRDERTDMEVTPS